MKILIACEESQRICIAFRNKGHEAYSCDVQEPSGGHPEWHIKTDVLGILNPQNDLIKFQTEDGIQHTVEGKWDLIVAHPPCQFLTNSGNKYFNVEKYGQKAIQRIEDRKKAYDFFMAFVNADCDKICIENPIGYMNSHYRKPDQIFHPWQFGDSYTKGTCLWLKGLPPLIPTVKEKPENCKSSAIQTQYDKDGISLPWNCEENRKIRSKTPFGFAEQVAEQWG